LDEALPASEGVPHIAPVLQVQRHVNHDALHALIGLEATPVKQGHFQYTHPDSGLVFELGIASPALDGKAWFTTVVDPTLC
jgi:hypothetical protein